MGNAGSTSKGTALVAVAEMMHLTKPQVMDIREMCAAMASKDGQIRRKLFHIAVAKSGVQGHLDTEILDLVFTMWDKNCDNRVPFLDFIVGIAPLACRYENMNSALKFVLQVMDRKESGKIDSSGIMSILRSINRTASFLGDSVLTENQMYKVADSVFDTITMISSDSESIDQSECVKTLLHEPLIEKFMAGTPNAGTAKRHTNLKINTNHLKIDTNMSATMSTTTNTSANMVAAVSTSALKRPLSNRSVTFADWKQREQFDQQTDGAWNEEKIFEHTRLEPGEDESAFSTDQSSIMLTPLNRVRVYQNRVRVTATTTSSGSDIGPRQVPRVELRGY